MARRQIRQKSQKEMQKAKDSKGSPVFLPEDWKTKNQWILRFDVMLQHD